MCEFNEDGNPGPERQQEPVPSSENMCEFNEDGNPGPERQQEPVPSLSKCVKCKESSSAIVIRAGDPYCRNCFKEYFLHKFRAVLGKHRVIFPGDKVLLAVSGGASSSSMLRQVQEGLSRDAHKKLRFSPGIIYIDEGGALGRSMDQRRAVVSELRNIFKRTGFPVHLLPLEQVLDLPPSALVTLPSTSEPPGSYKAAAGRFIGCEVSSSPVMSQEDEAPPEVQESQTRVLQQLMDSVKTLTAKEELLHTLRQHLLVHTARTKGYAKLMLGDNCTRLSIKLLSNVSMGRGAQLAQDTDFSDSRFGDVIIVRPMRDFSAKEISFYNHMFRVDSVFTPGLDSKSSVKSSIQRLTENFVTKLQTDFPSTVSTIYRTSEKLKTSRVSSSDLCDLCLLCLCPLDTHQRPEDTDVEEASAFQATRISETFSRSARTTRSDGPGLNPGPEEPSGESCSGGADCGKTRTGGTCCSSASEPGTLDVRSLLCYSCQLIIKDMTSLEQLPHYILSEAQRRTRRSQMRAEISEFLLD